jgi:competence protein ComEA
MRKYIALGLVLAFSLVVISPLLAEEKIDLNKATAKQIQTLQGVSQKTAAAIVAERNAKGPFLSSSDCARRVKGLDYETTAKWDSVKCSLPEAKSDHPTSEHPK